MKKLLCVIPLIILFCFTIACQDKAAMAESERAEIVKAIETAADNLASAISRLDVEGVTNLFGKIDGTKYISDGAFIPREELNKTLEAFYGSLQKMDFSFDQDAKNILQIQTLASL